MLYKYHVLLLLLVLVVVVVVVVWVIWLIKFPNIISLSIRFFFITKVTPIKFPCWHTWALNITHCMYNGNITIHTITDSIDINKNTWRKNMNIVMRQPNKFFWVSKIGWVPRIWCKYRISSLNRKYCCVAWGCFQLYWFKQSILTSNGLKGCMCQLTTVQC